MIKNRIKSVMIALCAFIIIIGSYHILSKQHLNSIEQTNRLVAMQELTVISDQIQMSLNLDLQFANFFAFLIANDPHLDTAFITDISKPILEEHRSIQNIALAPGGIVSYVYPLEGNEDLLGYDLLACIKTTCYRPSHSRG